MNFRDDPFSNIISKRLNFDRLHCKEKPTGKAFALPVGFRLKKNLQAKRLPCL
jgi:hypothetical protein